MLISIQTLKNFRNVGLELIQVENEIRFIKKKNTKGNFIAEWRNDIDSIVECPAIDLTIKDKSD